MFDLMRDFIVEYRLDTFLLVELAKEKQLSLTQTLNDIPYILTGYFNIVYPKATGGSNG